MSQAWNRVWKRDDEIQNLPHFQFIWCGCWWMHRWTMAVLPHMCIGFPTLLMEQTIVTSYNDVTRISQSIEGNIKGECNQARGLWLLLSLSSGSFDTSVKLFTRPQTLYLSCLSAPWVGRISWMYSVVCFSHKHGWPRSLVSPSPVMSLTSKGPSWGLSFFRTAVCQQIYRWGSPRGIKPKRQLSWKIYSGTSWSSSFYSIIWYGPGYGPLTFLQCHGVDGEVGQFSYLCPCTC